VICSSIELGLCEELRIRLRGIPRVWLSGQYCLGLGYRQLISIVKMAVVLLGMLVARVLYRPELLHLFVGLLYAVVRPLQELLARVSFEIGHVGYSPCIDAICSFIEVSFCLNLIMALFRSLLSALGGHRLDTKSISPVRLDEHGRCISLIMAFPVPTREWAGVVVTRRVVL